MKTTLLTKWFYAIFLGLALVESALGQVTTGVPAFSSIAGGPDLVNLANMNFHWNFPVLRKAGRGLPFSYSLEYDSSIWAPVQVDPTPPGSGDSWQPQGGWGWIGQSLTGNVTYDTLFNEYSGCYTFVKSNYQDGAGAMHSFDGQVDSCTPPFTAAMTTPDGSGYVLTATLYGAAGTNWVVVHSRSGVTINPTINGQGTATSVIDTNGNKLSQNSGFPTTF